LIVGHLTIPIILTIKQTFALLTLAILPRSKGSTLALLWATTAEGTEPG